MSWRIFLSEHYLTRSIYPTDPKDEELIWEGQRDGWNIQLECQPPNSPDLNVLDLGYFRSIQSLQHQRPSTTVDGLLQTVKNSFESLDKESLESIFLTLQACTLEMLKRKGNNDYTLPHLGKKKLSHEGKLPDNLSCPEKVYIDAYTHLAVQDDTYVGDVTL